MAKKTFAANLERYANLSDGKMMCEPVARTFEHLRDKVLREELIVSFIKGIGTVLGIFQKPTFPTDCWPDGCTALLMKVFNIDPPELNTWVPKAVWQDYLREVRNGEILAATSQEDLLDVIAKRFVNDYGHAKVMQSLSEEAARTIKVAIASLSPKQADVIYMKYGITRQKQTPSEIRQELNVTQSRMQQLEATALMHLKKRLNDFGFHLTFQTALNRARQKIAVLENAPTTIPSLKTLLVRIDDLFPLEDYWSIRAANCLQNANIRFLGDLIQRSEAEMLRTRNFGRKQLQETKAILARLNLTLGIRLDPQLLEAFEKERARLLAK